MGNEAPCKLRHGGKTYAGKALLETSELLFRGETRLKILFTAIRSLRACDGELHVRTKEGLSIFELAERAEKWREKIANPKTLLDKLGVKSGERISLTGEFAPGFLASLKKQDLQQVKTVARALEGSTALWIVYPKGQAAITETDVRSAGLRAGLTDIKVARFSATHTALKFVIRKAKR